MIINLRLCHLVSTLTTLKLMITSTFETNLLHYFFIMCMFYHACGEQTCNESCTDNMRPLGQTKITLLM